MTIMRAFKNMFSAPANPPPPPPPEDPVEPTQPHHHTRSTAATDIVVPAMSHKPPAPKAEPKALEDSKRFPKWVQQALDNDSRGEGTALVRSDGITHVNIGGRTVLGQDLAHFAHMPFVHPFYGPFNCMEGFWYYIKAQHPDDTLRSLVGYRAKDYGKDLPMKKVDNFKELIIEANYYRINQNPEFRDMFVNCELPFDHYYLYGEGNLLIRPKGFEWIVEGFEELRIMFREGRVPKALHYPT